MYNLMLKVAMAFNNVRFLGEEPAKSTDANLKKVGNDLVDSIMSIMKIVLPIVFAIVTVIGVAYAIILGVNYAKAEDNEKREEAKKRLVGAVVGFGIAIVVSALLWILAGTIDWSTLFGGSGSSATHVN